MAGPVLHRIHPTGSAIEPDPAEPILRGMYEHPPHTTRLGLIRSYDGKAAGPDGSSRSLNGPEDLRILLTLRAVADVVLVGAATVRQERYGDLVLPAALAQARDRAIGPRPHLAILTRTGTVPEGLDAATTWILTGVDTDTTLVPAPLRHRVITLPSDHPEAALAALYEQGLTRVLCEGGPRIARWLTDAGLIDDYCLTTSARPGSEHAPTVPPVPAGMHLAHRLAGGDFIIERWSR